MGESNTHDHAGAATSLPRISDATLRDSAHMAGVDFGPDDARCIARLLLTVGVDVVEVGIVSATDRRDVPLVEAVIEEAGPERTMTLVIARTPRQTAADVRVAAELGCRRVMLSIPASPVHASLKLGTDDPRRVLSLARMTIADAKALGMTVTFSAEDGARTDPAFLERYVAVGAEAGADIFRLAETVSVLNPAACKELLARLVAAAPGVEHEMHSHNMLGLAVANALAAVEGGARWISTTVFGLGERGGNTPLAEVLCCLRVQFGDDRHALEALTPLTHEVARRSGVPASPTAGPTGALSYAYEIAGQLRHPDAFEAIPAEVVGNKRIVRVRSRLNAPLLRLYSGEVEAERIDALVDELRSALPPGKAVWTEADLTTFAHERLGRSYDGRNRISK